MYVAKDLALILKDRWFNECSFDSNCSTTQGLHTYIPDYEDGLYIPNEQVLDWLFKKVYIKPENGSQFAAFGTDEVEWLQFWYTTLLEHNFGLMHEFIGRLEEWFESNGYYTDIGNSYKKKGVTINDRIFSVSISHKKYHNESDYNTVRFLKLDIDTKQQAKHEAIIKCFELLKTDKPEE